MTHPFVTSADNQSTCGHPLETSEGYAGGTCGFPAISGCTCHAGQCEGTGADAGAKVQ